LSGILLVNLGTPAAPTEDAVRAYLAEFLADRRVVDLPRWLWLPILHGVVLRARPARSAEKYAAIWTPAGSPLAVHTQRQAGLLAEKTGRRVEYAMRYGQPDMHSAMKKLGDAATVVPLYPQYSESATGSVLDLAGKGNPAVREFHAHPAYLSALAAGVRRHWAAHGRGGTMIFSYHGLPRRRAGPYQGQCLETSALLAKELGLQEYRVTFQSRFGWAPWLEPYTQPTLIELAREGVGRADVLCPGLVSDCLETLEEIGLTARAAFLAAGGREFHLLPCLNESPEWIEALARIAEEA
jgi:ferrochelatase